MVVGLLHGSLQWKANPTRRAKLCSLTLTNSTHKFVSNFLTLLCHFRPSLRKPLGISLQCKEVANPALQNVPLAITQKHIVVTSNTEARKRGVQKLQSIDDAKRACPEICLQSGEDLTPFRNASKANEKVARRFGVTQRSGLDELFIDVTEEVSRRLAHPTSRETERAIQWRGHRATPNVIASNHRRPMDIAAASECQPSPDEEDHQGGNVAINRLKLATHVAEDIRSSLKAETGFRYRMNNSYCLHLLLHSWYIHV